MGISKEQWEDIERELSYALGHVKLKCDSYEVDLCVAPIDSLQYGVLVHVNGVFKGQWIIEDCEERRRFLRPVARFLYNAKERAELIKIYGGKRAPKKNVETINRKITFYQTYWTSVKALRRHLEKHNRELALVSIGGVAVAKVQATSELPAALAVA